MPKIRYITVEEAIMLHEDQLQSDGGTSGIRDVGLLESALAQPQASFFGELLHPNISDQAAAYVFHIAKNHPFVDGNKRTAFAVCSAFLLVNGYDFNIAIDELKEIILNVANGSLSKEQLLEIFSKIVVSLDSLETE
ncbi:death-on-curing family protein [Thalassoporum mexicanum PCC 7367]|nr:death-on-curing family protein [Pseudanabaena sp. PCC 7367]